MSENCLFKTHSSLNILDSEQINVLFYNDVYFYNFFLLLCLLSYFWSSKMLRFPYITNVLKGK